jgi:biotin synthase
MCKNMKKLIDDTKCQVLSEEQPDPGVLLRMLRLDPNSEECAYLGKRARDVAEEVTDGIGSLNSSIGLDWMPCPISCAFCSLGKKWGLVSGNAILDDDDVIDTVDEVIRIRGLDRVTLRTTETYDLQHLLELGRRIRREVSGKYRLALNTRTLTKEDADELHKAGFSSAYHALRLGEGTDTPFDPEDRIRTMRAIAGSKLMLTSGIDPVGVEHTNEEILLRIGILRELGAKSVCSMRRKNVAGTPKGGLPEVSDKRMAQIAAVLRMAHPEWGVASSPIIPQSLEWGANSISVETGASPRRDHPDRIWNIMSHDEAEKVLEHAGYTLKRNRSPD